MQWNDTQIKNLLFAIVFECNGQIDYNRLATKFDVSKNALTKVVWKLRKAAEVANGGQASTPGLRGGRKPSVIGAPTTPKPAPATPKPIKEEAPDSPNETMEGVNQGSVTTPPATPKIQRLKTGTVMMSKRPTTSASTVTESKTTPSRIEKKRVSPRKGKKKNYAELDDPFLGIDHDDVSAKSNGASSSSVAMGDPIERESSEDSNDSDQDFVEEDMLLEN
ncbi:MAG: hypothetical protein M1833_003340 [Piccolia ochrophora]|nr:MAG: hypothetical protein M1833_003340 [Piccolia ochrophora]